MPTVLLIVSASNNVTVEGSEEGIMGGIKKLNTTAYFDAAWRVGSVAYQSTIRKDESDDAFARRIAAKLPATAEAMYS